MGRVYVNYSLVRQRRVVFVLSLKFSAFSAVSAVSNLADMDKKENCGLLQTSFYPQIGGIWFCPAG
jgi:hypothetical protein